MSTTTNDGLFREPSQLWEIVRAVAESKPFQGEGYRECLFCDLPDGETHELSCIVMKARALVEQAKEREG